MSNIDTPYILAIDLGTSGPKVALVTPAGEVVASARESTQLHFVGAHGVEQDPHKWWQAIVCATRRMLAHANVTRERITGICCTSQWSGTVAVDAEGAPLHNAIIWMDSRRKKYVDQMTWGPLRVEGYGVDKLWAWLRRTGGIPTRSGKDPIAHILFLKHERPEIYRQTYKFLEPKDYLNLRLTGRCATTPGAITLHWVTDNRTIDAIDYDPTLLRLAGVEREKLPDIIRSVDLVGTITTEAAAELGLSDGILVAGGAPDIHSNGAF